MNRKARRRAIWLMERRRLLREAKNAAAGGGEPFRCSWAPWADGIGIDLFRPPYGELLVPSER